MRWDGDRESANVEDRRGGGGGGFPMRIGGLGAIIVLIGGLLLGVDPSTLLSLLNGDQQTHWGSFFGNAIADWTGVVVTVIATKYFFEVGSSESRRPPRHFHDHLRAFLSQHSLTIFLVGTGIVWTVLFWKMDAQGKWGQVVGNIVSEWTQLLGLVLLTKRLVERKSEE